MCLRICINQKRAGHSYNELTGVSASDHLLKCVKSLIISINEAVKSDKKIKLTIFDDRSDSVSLDKINNLLNIVKCDWEIIKTENTGQGGSLYEHFNFALDKRSAILFSFSHNINSAWDENGPIFSDISEPNLMCKTGLIKISTHI